MAGKLTRGIDIRPWKTDTIGTIGFSRSLPGIFLKVLESVREMAESGEGLVRTGNKDLDKGGFAGFWNFSPVEEFRRAGTLRATENHC
ncbi:hypothetical protein QLX08_000263 [Tetragonisca angustula]|uniref:Uncharacterized protein n=1 Tax=Tetragonisca angustula TaxID=166442 RepID=A0AAW1AN57_9HYME